MTVMQRVMRRARLLLFFLLSVAAPGGAQTSTTSIQPSTAFNDQAPERPLPASPPIQSGRTGTVGTGVLGQRQTRSDAAPFVQPTARINSRIANRIQSRIRNRIDRNYDPQANSTSPFKAAAEESKKRAK